MKEIFFFLNTHKSKNGFTNQLWGELIEVTTRIAHIYSSCTRTVLKKEQVSKNMQDSIFDSGHFEYFPLLWGWEAVLHWWPCHPPSTSWWFFTPSWSWLQSLSHIYMSELAQHPQSELTQLSSLASWPVMTRVALGPFWPSFDLPSAYQRKSTAFSKQQ